jgi:hypothetical protein
MFTPLRGAPCVPSLHDKLVRIHLYDNEFTDEEPVDTPINEYVEPYKKSIDNLILCQNRLDAKNKEILELKNLVASVEHKTPHTEKLVKIIEDFCQDGSIEQIKNDYISARREFSKYRGVFTLVKNMDLLNNYLCFVCLANPVDICLNPCGHVLCSTCTRKIGSSCPYCRITYESQTRLYLS